MPGTAKASRIDLRAVRLWLLATAVMIFLTLVVGGATRLTESGLSIVEWKPITGVLPPFSENDWQAEFAKYQTIPQYRELNRGMRLDDFKVIYLWEWSHRLLARLIGVVFLLPFLFFLWRGVVPANLRVRLWVIFGAGAGLGAVGWWMVSSGLTQRVSVSQYRLAFHLTLATVIYAAILWTAQQMKEKPSQEGSARIRIGAATIAWLLLLQIYLGALVAGLDAGLIYNTWPEIDGAFVPAQDRLWFLQPAWHNLFENTLMVQFNHRMVAYAIWALAMLHAFDAWRTRQAAWGAAVLAGAVTLQAGLGVVTLLYQAPLLLALAHQVLAILVLTIAVVHAERWSHRAVYARIAKPAGRQGGSIIVLPPLGLDPALADLAVTKAASAATSLGMSPEQVTLVLLAHGSARSRASAMAAERTAINARAHGGLFADVRVSFLDEAPSLEMAMSEIEGAIAVAGLFSGDGLHGGDDAKRLMAQLNRDDVIYVGNVGLFSGLKKLIAAAINNAIAA